MRRAIGWGLVGGLAILSVQMALAAPKDTLSVQTALDGSGSTVRETNAGNLVADAVRKTGQADVGLVTADEIADTTVPAGSIAPSRLADLLRYAQDGSDTVVVLKLTGAQILRALELGVAHAPRPFNGFWQVSGLQVRYDATQPEGRRVSLAGIGGSEISAGKTYTVATTHPVALGSLGYFRVWDKKDIAQDTGVSLAQSVQTYARAHQPLNAVVEGRITAAH